MGYQNLRKNLTHKILSFFPYKRRKQIEDFDFIMVFNSQFKTQLEVAFSKITCKDKMKYTCIEHQKQKQIFYLIKLTDQVVIDQAHNLRILKKKDKSSYKLDLKSLNKLIYSDDVDTGSNYFNYLAFLRARLSKENQQVFQQQQYSAFNKNKIQKYELHKTGKFFSKSDHKQQDKARLFTPEQQLRAKYNFLLTYSENIKSQVSFGDINFEPFVYLMTHQAFKQLVPIHKASCHRPLILESIRDYAGANGQTYFEFVGFMQKWLIFPTIIGLLTVAANSYFEYTADNSPLDFFYALFIMIWSILFITRWEKDQQWQKIKQQSGYNDLWSEHQDIIVKKDLEKRDSLITGKKQHFLPFKKKLLYYGISISVCTFILFVSLVWMAFSLNARGYVKPHHRLLFSDSVSNWASQGGIFDMNTYWGMIPTIVHGLVINIFDEMLYRPLAKKMTKFETHYNNKSYENSIILKFFIYEFIVTFADLFYIAFVCFDVMGLRQQLLTLFITDIVRRLVAESLIPWLKKTYLSKSLRKQKFEPNSPEELRYSAIVQVSKQHYEPFDDYLQIVTNFGYLVMISSCFPLAPFLILIAHAVEIVQDKYKSIHIFKRKLPQKYVGMGYWKTIIVFLCYFSIITNIMLFAFSSQQIVNFLPQLYEGGKDILYGNTDISDVVTGAGGIFFSLLQSQNIVAGALMNQTNSKWGFNFDVPFFGKDNSDVQGQQKPDFESPEFPGNQQKTTEQDFMKNDGWGDFWQKKQQSNGQVSKQETGQTGNKINNVFVNMFDSPKEPQPQETLVLTQYKAPTKQHEGTFIVVLFFIQHFFLFAFLTIRYILMKQTSAADVFLKRRQYKRRIKKHLPRDVMSVIMSSMVVEDVFSNLKKEQTLSTMNSSGTINAFSNILQGTQEKERQQLKFTERTNDRTTINSDLDSQIEEKQQILMEMKENSQQTENID